MCGTVGVVSALALVEATRVRFAAEGSRHSCELAALQQAFRGTLVHVKRMEERGRELERRNAELAEACAKLMLTHPLVILAQCSRPQGY
jgi:hypothetical protein